MTHTAYVVWVIGATILACLSNGKVSAHLVSQVNNELNLSRVKDKGLVSQQMGDDSVPVPSVDDEPRPGFDLYSRGDERGPFGDD